MADNEDFASLLSEFEQTHPGAGRRGPKAGDKVKGKVLSVGADQVLVDLGGKFEGVLPLEAVLDGEGNPKVGEGDRIEAEYSHGIIQIRLPKTDDVKPKKIEIKVN